MLREGGGRWEVRWEGGMGGREAGGGREEVEEGGKVPNSDESFEVAVSDMCNSAKYAEGGGRWEKGRKEGGKEGRRERGSGLSKNYLPFHRIPTSAELNSLVSLGPTLGQPSDYVFQLVSLLDSLAETPSGIQIISENSGYVRSLLSDVLDGNSLPISQVCIRYSEIKNFFKKQKFNFFYSLL
jgi:hypothetical protein